MMKVSFYKNALANDGVEVNIIDILNGIRDGRWEKQVQYLRSIPKEKYDTEKKYLPAATFSGTFNPTRHDDNIVDYTGIITLDFDHLEGLLDVKDKLRRHPSVISVFTSPSDEGLKALIKVDSTKENHGKAFDFLKDDIKRHTGIDIDKSGRNISRLCFVSHDPDIHINMEATHIAIPKEVPDTKVIHDDAPPPGVDTNNRKIIRAEKITRSKHSFVKGSRNSYIFFLSCCLNRLGVPFNETHEHIINTYRDYNYQEARASIKSAYKNKDEFNKWTLDDINDAPDIEINPDVAKTIVAERLRDMFFIFAKNPDSGLGPRTFIPEVDDAIGGSMQKGNLYGMIGRDGTFKSIMAMFIAIENARNGIGSIYLNMEMSKIQLAQRIVQYEVGENIMKLKREGRFTEEYAEGLAQRLDSIEKNMLVVSDSNIPYSGLADAIRTEVARHGDIDVQLVIVDGISSMADEGNKGEVQAAIDNSMKLKELAKSLNIAILCLSHTRNDCDKHIRNTGPFVRGGLKITGNMDGYFCHSLLVDPKTNDTPGQDVIYRDSVFYMRFIDKRGSGGEINKIISIGDNLRVDITELNPFEQEIQIKR